MADRTQDEIERLEARLGFTLTPWQREMAEQLVEAQQGDMRAQIHLSRMHERAIAKKILHALATDLLES